MTDHYAVFGNPIAQSLSPLIHAEFARQTGRDICYQRQLVGVDEFDAAAEKFFVGGGKGLNITVPFKLNAFGFATELTERAQRAGAVNTLALQHDESVLGDNTDGVGIVEDIATNRGWPINGRRILLIGAGGAVRGVLEPLLAQSPKQLSIVNRTSSKAEVLARDFADLGNVSGCGLDDLDERDFDLVINGTSASLAGELPPLPSGTVTSSTSCYDMMYSAQPTVFLQWAAGLGVTKLSDGLGMLVEQAAAAFFLWHGVKPETAGVIELIRRQLSNVGE
mgnify:CR=1 FL=1